MVYTTEDGERFEADSARDLLRQMRGRSLYAEVNHDEWLHAVASRVRKATGKRLDTTSEAEFVQGLIAAGLLKEEGTPDV